MVGKPAPHGIRLHLSPELTGVLFLPVGLALVYAFTAGLCFIIHWR